MTDLLNLPWHEARVAANRRELVEASLDAIDRLNPKLNAFLHVARDALTNYWRALEGTLDEEKVRRATNNALIGDAEAIATQMRDRFHPEDRLMLWFDFNNHDSKRVMKNMDDFMNKIAPRMSRLTGQRLTAPKALPPSTVNR